MCQLSNHMLGVCGGGLEVLDASIYRFQISHLTTSTNKSFQ